jgi:hypothetical protein
MLSYSLIKTFHLAGVFLVLTAMAILFFSDNFSRLFKVISHVALFVILITGLGLVVHLSNGVPPWVMMKFILWLILSIAGIFATTHLRKYRLTAYILLVSTAALAAFLAIHKPF